VTETETLHIEADEDRTRSRSERKPTLNETFGSNLAYLRKNASMTQKDLAERMKKKGVPRASEDFVSKLERGIGDPKLYEVGVIEEVLQCGWLNLLLPGMCFAKPRRMDNPIATIEANIEIYAAGDRKTAKEILRDAQIIEGHLAKSTLEGLRRIQVRLECSIQDLFDTSEDA
jgi:transcriptional regulator with XRE-family HTH domain